MLKGLVSPLFAAGLLLVSVSQASAESTRVDVKTRADIGTSGFEKIVGTAYFAVDPMDHRNQVVADIDQAPMNSAGRVECSSDLYIIRPKDAARSNGTALVDVLSRGRKPVLGAFVRGASNVPSTDADLGDHFLLDHGGWAGNSTSAA